MIGGTRKNPPRSGMSAKSKGMTERQMAKVFGQSAIEGLAPQDVCRGSRRPSKHGWKGTMWDGDARPSWSPTAAALIPGVCALCGGVATDRDHIVPYRVHISDNAEVQVFCDGTCHYAGVSAADAYAWSNDMANLQPLCSACNGHKAADDKLNPNNVSAPPTLIGPCPAGGCPACGEICL